MSPLTYIQIICHSQFHSLESRPLFPIYVHFCTPIERVDANISTAFIDGFFCAQLAFVNKLKGNIEIEPLN